jgi:fermentation-respiration switch protein FrsA (DUF1100 family)
MTPDHDSSSRSETPRPGRPWSRRLLRAFTLYVVTPYLAVTLIFACLQRRFLYPATRSDRLLAADVAAPGAEVTDVALHAANGVVLHGWHFRAVDGPPVEERLLVLYFPGNAGNRGDRVQDCLDFTRLGCDVLILDYRGYGDSDGSPSEALLAVDARRAWMHATREQLLDVPSERIVLFGESIGGAVAVRLAAEFSLAGYPPAGLVLNSTFAALPETVAWHYPWFPFQFLLFDCYPSVERIPHVTCPILQFHGTDDEFVPLEHGRGLFEAAPETSASGVAKRFVPVEGGTHNGIPVALLRKELLAFLGNLSTKTSTVPPRVE